MNTQSGRSMVEMLGVLAIIGVLSVGAIAGYSKAMFKYRLNKQTEQLNTVVNAVARNVHSFDNMRKSEDYTVELTPYFIKLGEIPKEMIKSGVSTEFYDVFNSTYDVRMEPSYNWIILYIYPPLATRSEQNLDICRNMIITIKENAGDISYLQTLHYLGGGNNYALVTYLGDKYCTNGERCVRDMALNDIYEMCTKHIGQVGTHMKIGWYL